MGDQPISGAAAGVVEERRQLALAHSRGVGSRSVCPKLCLGRKPAGRALSSDELMPGQRNRPFSLLCSGRSGKPSTQLILTQLNPCVSEHLKRENVDNAWVKALPLLSILSPHTSGWVLQPISSGAGQEAGKGS